MITTAIYPGTFDPITNGHLDIIERSAQLFDKIVVGVANNPTKKTMFSLEQREKMLIGACKHIPNIEVIAFSGLLAELIINQRINLIIRGVRGVTDFEYELQLSHLNKMLTKGVESIFLPPSSRWSYISSTMIREIILHEGSIDELVPFSVIEHINKKP